MNPPNLKTVRQIARAIADGASEGDVRFWPHSRGERQGIEQSIAERLDLPSEHRRRVYYAEVMLVAMNAYDARMLKRQRALEARQRAVGR